MTLENQIIEEIEEQPEGLNIKTSEEAIYVYKNYSKQKIEQRDEIQRRNACKPEWIIRDDIVVSGMSGRFPESDSVEEFATNLYNNVDLIVEDERRWPFNYMGLPKGCGKIKNIGAFDNEFFRIDVKEADHMDAQVRIMLEITYEALWDAGIDPTTLANTNTGVFLGNCFDEFLAAHSEDGINLPEYKQCFFAMLHNVYGFQGPAKHFDSACASGFSALHEAMVSLRSGECERALVVGLNICLRAGTQKQFLILNMLSPDGHCKCLDDDANGYAKGEACAAIVLQRRSEAKRIYATIVHTKTNCDGYKDLGITYPSFEIQRELISNTYREIGIDPNEVDYCEAHCTGTQAGDPSEMRAIVESMCVNRDKPLLIGAIKSIIGHTEASSGICSLIKTILSFERELIPANLFMDKINHRIDGLVSGQLLPIVENTPFKGNLIGLNCFGFGGVNVHAIIRKNPKEPISNDCFGNLPRLILFCGRNFKTLEKIEKFLLQNNPKEVTKDFLGLLNEISKTSPLPAKKINGMNHRQFLLATPDASGSKLNFTQRSASNKIEEISTPPICFVYTGMGCQWSGMGEDLDRIPVIAEVFDRCSTALKQLNEEISLESLLTSNEPKLLQSSPINSFVAIAAIQIALTELLKFLDIQPDHYIGHSIGELLCAYADGCLTLEETIQCAYLRGKSIEEMLIKRNRFGGMAALGCTLEQANEYCRKYSEGKISIACLNSIESVTVSGPKEEMEKFLQTIQKNEPDLFVRPVNSSNIAFHCSMIDDFRSPLIESLQNVIKTKRSISSKWLGTTYEQRIEDFDANYLADNLIKPVRFYQTFQKLPKESIFIEIAPHNLLKSIIKRNLLDRSENSFRYSGMLTKLVSPRESNENLMNLTTPSLNSFIVWEHTKNFKCLQYPEFFNYDRLAQSLKQFDLQTPTERFYSDHCIDGRVLFPATGYLYLAWEMIAKILNVPKESFPIIFEDVFLHRATIMNKSGLTSFTMKFNQSSGSFSIMESGTLTTTGKVYLPRHDDPNIFSLELKIKDIYKEFRLRGYDYGQEFQSIQHLEVFDKTALAKICYKNWITFVDGMIQTAVIGRPIRGLFVPVRLKYLRFDPKIFFENLNRSETKILDTMFDGRLNIGVAKGIEFQGIKANLAPRKLNTVQPIEEISEFVKHFEFDLPLAFDRFDSEDDRLRSTELLRSYQDDCHRMIVKSHSDESIESELIESKRIKPILWNYLKELLAIKSKEEFDPDQQRETLFDIECDRLFDHYLNELFLRPSLETVMENILGQNVNILEVGQTKWIVADEILRLIKWIQKMDLIVYKDSSIFPLKPQQRIDYNSLLESIKDCLNDERFALFLLRDQVYPIERALSEIFGISIEQNIADKFRVQELLNLIDKSPLRLISHHQHFINLTSNLEDWFDELQIQLKQSAQHSTDDDSKRFIWLIANEDHSGVIGMVNCLRREPNGDKIQQTDPSKTLLLNVVTRGDLSSLQWFESQHKHIDSDGGAKRGENLFTVYYAPLNFRDIMLATGKLPPDALPDDMGLDDCILGLEFAGRNSQGQRVMGMVPSKGLASTLILNNDEFVWTIPEGWSMEEASTVPVAYATAYYALCIRGKLKRNETVLIHSGSGAVGQAAISICLSYQCRLFITVGSIEKQNFLVERFANQLKPEQFASSRNTDFEK
ncbi:Fatty acid synthase [Sarcoptes scabiei]|uniref:Fatty acid synthase n=1 Tax=Sarcoptes scabiei TaxID=52283 RepID=A0A834VE72_SARSC|nr:Fatty acid synthase [Sarcoptes scabiei]